IAHEFGHAAHYILTDRTSMDWNSMEWTSPYVWLLQEGAATHFSRQIVPDLEPSVYFTYDYSGEEWFRFVSKHKRQIIRAFCREMLTKNSGEVFKEWFSINGGSLYGFNR